MTHLAKQNPYAVILKRHIKEKSMVLQGLETATSNRSVARCKSPKTVFVVHPDANKQQIAEAVEAIYQDRGVKVVKVNVLNVKPKARRVRNKRGYRAGFKKAIVTLRPGDQLEAV
jgi:large subunit ribosomal protein L23